MSISFFGMRRAESQKSLSEIVFRNIKLYSIKMAEKIRSHYIPKFYLEGFLSPLKRKPTLYLYEKGNSEIRRASPEDAAVIKGYYSIDSPQSNIDENIVENILSLVESYSAPVIRKIKNKEELNNDDRENFSVFLGYMLTRVPQHRKMTEDLSAKAAKSLLMAQASHKEGFEVLLKQYEKDTGKKINYPVEKLRRFLMDASKYDFKAHPNISLTLMHTAIELAPIFIEMNWSFWGATDESKYITSDNPLYYFDRTAPSHEGAGLINKNIELYFPVSRDIMFVGSWHNISGYRKSDSNNVRGWNKNTIIFALRFVFASQYSEGLNRIVQRYIDSAPKVEVIWGGKKM